MMAAMANATAMACATARATTTTTRRRRGTRSNAMRAETVTIARCEGARARRASTAGAKSARETRSAIGLGQKRAARAARRAGGGAIEINPNDPPEEEVFDMTEGGQKKRWGMVFALFIAFVLCNLDKVNMSCLLYTSPSPRD